MRRNNTVLLLLAAVIAISFTPQAAALSWRLFAGREECLQEYMPDSQYKYAHTHLDDPERMKLFVDIGFLVTTKYGTEESRASVDYAIYTPSGALLHQETGVSEAEFGTPTVGSRGPWRVCFRVSSGALLRPSVTVNLEYFSIGHEEHLGEGFDWEDHRKPLDPNDLGTKEQIESLEYGLLRLDHYLMNVTHEQRYLYSRTVRHLRTAESTLRRTFWYYLAIYSVICLASFSQLVAVRMMFKKSRKHGLII